jgi:CRP-like cAMP-binding protein
MAMTTAGLLLQIPLFTSLRQAERANLTTLLRRLTLKKGEVLFRKGDEGAALYIVVQGRIKVAYPSKSGDEVTLAIFSNGEFFGEMALLDGMPRSADATALEETQLCVLNRSDFLSFIVSNPNAVQSVLHALSMRIRKTDDLLGETCFMSISLRLARRLVEMVQNQPAYDPRSKAPVELNLMQKDLASLLGVSRESINKELKALRDRGVVTTSRNTITIMDMDVLKRRMR